MKIHKKTITHIVHSFDIGGLENGIVNLINLMPESFQHNIICLSHYTNFYHRIHQNISIYALHKKPGKDFSIYLKLSKLFRELRSDIVHTRNLSTLECQLIAFLSDVKARIHGEH